MELVEKTVDFLLDKYPKATISYEGFMQVETYKYPKEALREAVLIVARKIIRARAIFKSACMPTKL